MIKKKIMFLTAILISTLFLVEYSFSVETKKEQKNYYRALFINTDGGVSEKTLIAKPGDTVTWINWTKVTAKIHFRDKRVVDVTDCPECFSIGEKGTYDSVTMSLNGTASLRFKKRGKYEYIVKEKPTHFWERGKEYRGTIWIK